MPREIVLSSFFAATLAMAAVAVAQDTAVPAPLTTPTPAPVEVSPDTLAKPSASPAVEAATEPAAAPATTGTTEATSAADGVVMPQKAEGPDNSLFTDPLQLTPLPPTLDDPSTPGADSIQKPKLNPVAKDEIKERVRYREARTKALADPAIRAEWDRAQQAKTDPEKREALKAYYTKLYDRVIKIDASVKERAELDQKLSIQRITQRRIRTSGEAGGETYAQ